MFKLQAEQVDGTWSTISTHATRQEADNAMRQRGGYRRRAVRYQVIAA